MAAAKGTMPPAAGKGRPKGSLNKSTMNAREAIARFVDGNSVKLQGWLDAIAKENGPLAATKVFIDLIEYHVPKLNRTEVANADDKPFAVDVNVTAAEAYAQIIGGKK